MQKLTAKASTTIDAPPSQVWAALTTPETIKRYFFGTDVDTDWEEGSPIRFSGDYQGKHYEDKGEILSIEPGKRLTYSHWSNISGTEDSPENYHRVTYELHPKGDQTEVTIVQEGAENEKARAQSEKNWASVLDGLKNVVEH